MLGALQDPGEKQSSIKNHVGKNELQLTTVDWSTLDLHLKVKALRGFWEEEAGVHHKANHSAGEGVGSTDVVRQENIVLDLPSYVYNLCAKER